jgi:signal transduction histidine kinase
VVLCLAGLAAAALAERAWAQSPPPGRFYRLFTQDDGLPSGAVMSLAQDPDGFLWIGTAGGLARYGGRDFVPVRPDVFGGGVEQLATSPTGRVAVVERGRRELWLGRGDEFERVAGPERPLRSIGWVQFDAGDTLWIIRRDGELLRRSPAGGWLAEPADGWLAGSTARTAPATAVGPAPDGDRFYRAFVQDDGSVLLATQEPISPDGLRYRASLWLWRAGRARRLAIDRPGLITTATRDPEGDTWFATNDGGDATIYRVGGGRLDTIAKGVHRPQALDVRSGVLYYSDPAGLRILREGGRSERISHRDPASGGPLLVDGEGSLWVGTATGLVQYPEPDATSWDAAHGLTGSHGEFIAVSPAGVWLSAWQGLGLLEPSEQGWRGRDVQDAYGAWPATRLCVDGDGTLWFTAWAEDRRPRLASIRQGTRRHHLASGHRIDCDTSPDGAVLIVADGAVHRTRAGGELETLGPAPDETTGANLLIAAGPEGTVHVVSDAGPALARSPSSCDATHAELQALGEAAWRCSPLPDIGELRDLSTAPGPTGASEVWLASFSGGVLHRVGGEWRRVEALDRLLQRATNGLARSPAGGIWAFGFGFAVRLETDEGEWGVVEELGGWHGVDGDVRSLWEEEDGTVWLASWQGVTRVPPSARSRPPSPPTTRLATFRVDGRSLPGGEAKIPSDHRTVELEFAAGSLRDPHRVRYRTRLDDVEWSDSREPGLRMARVRPGDHVVEVAASLDGLVWGPTYGVAFRVDSPWYARGWVIGLAVGLLGVLVLLGHRLRTAYLVGLERQRTRIAMDLHDELGAGLGSLGILGDVVAEGSAPPAAQRQMGQVIARTAAELGQSLHDIVYSLRTGEAPIEHLAEQVAGRGRTLFAGNGVRLSMRTVPAGDRTIAPTVSRHAYLIAVEALHNAARHAHAANIEVGLATTNGEGRIRLWVQDDGRGIDPCTLREPGGTGLTTMRRRAEAIGGTLTIDTVQERGTRVEVRFRPDGKGVATRWPRSWRLERHRRKAGERA